MFHILPTLVVLVLFLSLTVWGWSTTRHNKQEEIDRTISARSNEVEQAITKRFSVYEEILRGGVGLFAASEQVGVSEWQRYISLFDLQNRYPGSVTVGYIAVVADKDIAAYTDQQRQTNVPDFTVVVDANSDQRAILQYIEPLTERGKVALGHDIYSDVSRRHAMEKARDTGTAVISDRVRLVVDKIDNQDAAPAFAMYMPVYSSGRIPPTLQQRQAMLTGYVYAPFRGAAVLGGVFADKPKHVEFRIYSEQAQSDKMLYESPQFASLSQQQGAISYQQDLLVNQAHWIIDYRFSPEIVSSVIRNRPINALIFGSLVSVLVAGLVWVLLVARTRALASLKEREIQSAKDDLLSLASHQLRTPATGVKQYIGMVIEGYAGRLKPDQRAYLEKAYQSNERQLHIINDLLYVAKADAGRIVLAKREVHLKELLKDIVSEQKGLAREKNISLRLKVPRKNMSVFADKHCLRMAIENLLNNALKYTPEKGKVVIEGYEKDGQVCVSVKDTGVGIAAGDMALLFNRFSRIPNELSGQTSGSGIGLYLAKHLVELHEGTISVDSVVKKGTTFTICLAKYTSPLNSGA